MRESERDLVLTVQEIESPGVVAVAGGGGSFVGGGVIGLSGGRWRSAGLWVGRD